MRKKDAHISQVLIRMKEEKKYFRMVLEMCPLLGVFIGLFGGEDDGEKIGS